MGTGALATPPSHVCVRVVTVVNAGQQGDGGPLDKPASDGGCAYYYIGHENR